jgi:hypothetical protein
MPESRQAAASSMYILAHPEIGPSKSFPGTPCNLKSKPLKIEVFLMSVKKKSDLAESVLSPFFQGGRPPSFGGQGVSPLTSQ